MNNTNRFKNMKWIFTGICIITVLFSASCSASVTPTSTLVQTTMSLTSSPTLLSPSATPPPIPTRTPAPPTLTPLPILRQPEEIKAKLFELLLNNGGCQLPCLFGFTPGIFSPQEMKNFFDQFSSIDAPEMLVRKAAYGSLSGVTFYFPYTHDIYIDMSFSEYKRGNQVETFTMHASSQPKWAPQYAEKMQYFMLPEIMTNYGEPSETIMVTYRDDRQRPDVTTAPFFLVLLYLDQGFYIKYEMERVTSGANFLGCPSKSFVSVVTWPAGNNEIFERTVKPTINGEYLSDYKSLADATSMTIEEFYQVFSNPANKDCIRTPIETWPNP